MTDFAEGTVAPIVELLSIPERDQVWHEPLANMIKDVIRQFTPKTRLDTKVILRRLGLDRYGMQDYKRPFYSRTRILRLPEGPLELWCTPKKGGYGRKPTQVTLQWHMPDERLERIQAANRKLGELAQDLGDVDPRTPEDFIAAGWCPGCKKPVGDGCSCAGPASRAALAKVLKKVGFPITTHHLAQQLIPPDGYGSDAYWGAISGLARDLDRRAKNANDLMALCVMGLWQLPQMPQQPPKDDWEVA